MNDKNIKIDEALLQLSELMEEEFAIYDFTIVAIGPTLKELLQHRVTTTPLTFCIPESQVLGEGQRNLRSLLSSHPQLSMSTIGGNGFSFKINDILVQVKILRDRYGFLKYPESFQYQPIGTDGVFTFFNIPNPIKDYQATIKGGKELA